MASVLAPNFQRFRRASSKLTFSSLACAQAISRALGLHVPLQPHDQRGRLRRQVAHIDAVSRGLAKHA
jgi:hypothetical protein